ncbi:MAG: TIGR01548 family HAD-type hydrolase [Cyanobacteriota bacterium]|nr:TIGR01548 family HAD-type hydrolase [Cyanobacteriota bacterium]
MVLFDIDGVIRDVSASYRRAIVETVYQYCGWRPEPEAIDALKAEGCWNNDWEASRELLRRRRQAVADSAPLPPFHDLVAVFSGHYFGGDPEGDPRAWRGFIGQEPLQVDGAFFASLSAAGIAWGFVSGAEPPSARFVLEQRLGLVDPPLIAMGDAPDKPDPSGLLQLAERLVRDGGGEGLGAAAPPVAYLGDTVADVHTVLRARERQPDQAFVSLAVAPPHLHPPTLKTSRQRYEHGLRHAGSDHILQSTASLLDRLELLGLDHG